MTHVEDIIHQVDAILTDERYPPTLRQKEIAKVILHKIHIGMTDFSGRF